jgi:hypothetical protein
MLLTREEAEAMVGVRRWRARGHFQAAGQILALVQAGYYLVTGIWPLVSIETFERVTGPKVDRWLVKTVGALVTAIGAALGVAAARPALSVELRLLALLSAGGLAAIDLVYVARRRIAPVYLLDAVLQLTLTAGWLAVWRGSDDERDEELLSSTGVQRH